MNYEKALVWFRRDLRDFDHAALHHALKASRTVYCAFIFDKELCFLSLKHKFANSSFPFSLNRIIR